jgi:uncharacterized protein with HEPN domain
MQREDRAAAYLWDMVQAARDAFDIVAGITGEQLGRDRVRMLALERSMELIGEAARRVSAGYCESHPQIPWREIIGLRNILAHEYGRIDHARLYSTALKELPGLIKALETLLPPDK